MIHSTRLAAAIDELDLAGRALIVHASLRSLKTPIDGGADTLLDTLLRQNCTVMVPAFTEPQFRVPAPTDMRPARNGLDYATEALAPESGPVFDVGCGLINSGLGTLPATLVKRADAIRGDHPLNSFAAIGPRAAHLIRPQTPDDVYAPLRRLAELDGAVLLAGVGLNRMTALHLAEQRSGRAAFRRWARDTAGDIRMVEVGSCSEGFPRLEPAIAPLAHVATVAAARWRSFPLRPTLAVATAAIVERPDITHCPDGACLLCRDSIAGGPLPL
ncbi:hypothetical protein Cme02nite_27660 [Catellatospora methionotrophica]|uniref:Aminoglycoside N(3)-acetyltransferase n=1 Tax=Catellatospora methionotrophica TaxID=121620 RepID=A0A8J3PF80_9ACTN|nr:AAC(3) family N-acetyltransferase [Catellatospora methionotrophica]GIG14434.1 hypothetical protein Cme02nite_27660 [Catellatospora methionotrophica]